MKISVYTPVKNEAAWIGYSVMSVLPWVHEVLLGVAPSEDGTVDLLRYIEKTYGEGKLRLDFDPVHDWARSDQSGYNASYNRLIGQSTADALWYLHADMICVNPEAIAHISPGPLAWTVGVRSFAGDMQTEITKGRAKQWKMIHLRKFGLHYAGAYGSDNEDMYFREITGKAHKHYGEDFLQYPFEVADSGVQVNHYCEMKPYSERFEKMKTCLKNQHPGWSEEGIAELAAQHPRVTLESSSAKFGVFTFTKSDEPLLDIFQKHKQEFEAFAKIAAHA